MRTKTITKLAMVVLLLSALLGIYSFYDLWMISRDPRVLGSSKALVSIAVGVIRDIVLAAFFFVYLKRLKRQGGDDIQPS
jgi:hypothetical protein